MLKQNENTISYLFCMPTGISRLEKMGETVFYPKNHTFIEAGNLSKYCYIVKKGHVAAYEICSNGEERIYGLYGQNAIFLEANLLLDRVSLVAFKTMGPTELVRINKNVLKNAVKADPDLLFSLLESTTDKFEASLEQLRCQQNYNITWKICNLFLDFAKYYGEPLGNTILIREKISQQMMSNMIGANRITTVRIIKKLKDEKIVGQIKGHYCIFDVERLKEFQKREAFEKNK